MGLELFGTKQRVDEIDEQCGGDETEEDEFEHQFFSADGFSAKPVPSCAQALV